MAQDEPQLDPADADQAGEKVGPAAAVSAAERLGEGGLEPLAVRAAAGRGRLGERGRDVLVAQRAVAIAPQRS